MRYRKTSAEDLARLNEWVAVDPAHKDVITGSFFAPSGDHKGVTYMTVEDEQGAVFYLRLENALRVYAQFPPGEEKNNMRLTIALKHAFIFVSRWAEGNGYHEMLFDSMSNKLINLFKRFKFQELANTFQVKL
jgi:hypothetical protein